MIFSRSSTVSPRDRHKVTATAVVVATNSPINDMLAVHTKQAPNMTYAIGAKVSKGSVPDALYHYVRIQEHDARHGILIVGGEDGKSGQQTDSDPHPRMKVEQWARERFPVEEDSLKWGGQCMETFDGLALGASCHRCSYASQEIL